MNAVKSFISNRINDIVGFFKKLPGRIRSALGNLKGILLNAGKAILQGLIDGIQSKFTALKSKLGAVTKLIPKWKGPPATDRVLLSDNGKLIIQGLISGMESKESALRGSLQGMTSNLVRTPLLSTGSSPRIGSVGPAPQGGLEASLVGARVEMGKDGFGTFVDGRIRLNNLDHAKAVRFG